MPTLTATRGKYLYCLIKDTDPKEFNVPGIDGGKVYSICDSGLAAVVSDADIKEYSISRFNTLTHQKVIEEVMKKYDVLPVSFGTVVESEANLKEKMLRAGKKALLGDLLKVKGKVELSLKAFWLDMPSIFKEIAEESAELKKLKDSSLKEKGFGRRNLMIEAGKIVADSLERKRNKDASAILKFLQEIALEFIENKAQSDQMVFSAAFLVSKEREKEFDNKVSELGKRYENRMKFLYVGPLPAFNFIKRELNLK